MKTLIYSIFIIPVLFLTGCYTILEHPKVDNNDENGFVYKEKVHFYDDCNSCHSESSVEYYHERIPIYKTHESYYSGFNYSNEYYGDYSYYYNTPWWYDVNPSNEGNGTSKYRDNANNSSETYESTRTRSGSSGLNLPPPTRSSGGDKSSSTSTNSSSTNSENKSTSETKNSGNSDRNSSDQSKSRSNDGGRSTSSGRRK